MIFAAYRVFVMASPASSTPRREGDEWTMIEPVIDPVIDRVSEVLAPLIQSPSLRQMNSRRLQTEHTIF